MSDKIKKWLAFEAANCEWEKFESFEAAKKWLFGGNDEGYPKEFINGESFIAEITHVTGVDIKERREDYCETDCCDECDKDEFDCGKEQWPYGTWEWVGDPKLIRIEEGTR